MQEQQIPEHKKFLNEKDQKQQDINMNLIIKNSLVAHEDLSEDDLIEKAIKLTSIHLEWLSISKIQNLEPYTDLTVLYLQHNCIKRIEGLESLLNLEYLALNNNQIETVENISHLKKLQGLNISNNCIEDLSASELPQSLIMLSVKENPVCMDIDYKQNILKRCRLLETLDEQTITPADKFKILGLLPAKLSTYASQMKQFYTKRQLQNKFENDSKLFLFNTEPINEKDALNEIRQTTRKYKYQNAESFKKDKADQDQFFNQKIAVSKKIREIKEQEESKRQRRLQEIKDANRDTLMQQRR